MQILHAKMTTQNSSSATNSRPNTTRYHSVIFQMEENPELGEIVEKASQKCRIMAAQQGTQNLGKILMKTRHKPDY